MVGKAELSAQHKKKEEVMFVFPVEGADVRQPRVHCVLYWLGSSFDLSSAGLCVSEEKRC